MKPDKILFLSICVFLLSVGICIVTLFNQDPRAASITRIVMFFLFLFLSITTLPINILLAHNLKEKRTSPSIKKLIRRCALVSLAIVGLLLMSSLSILNPLSAVTFVLALFLGELFLEGRTSGHHA